MSMRRVVPLLAVLSLSAGALEAQAAPRGTAGSFTLDDFQGGAWILGRWRGTGFGRLASVGEFHEEYTLVNDSTVLMRSYERAPFATATDSTRFEFRNGAILAVPSRGSTRTVARIAGDTIQWNGNGVRYVRVDENLWRALIPMAGAGADTYYEMRRITP